jgi:(p)ppGpp synthase/HD superfamily hydrolase
MSESDALVEKVSDIIANMRTEADYNSDEIAREVTRLVLERAAEVAKAYGREAIREVDDVSFQNGQEIAAETIEARIRALATSATPREKV